MGPPETQLLFAFLLAMLKNLIEGRSDTTELEKKIAAEAKDLESLQRILTEVAKDELGELGEVGTLAEDLIKADNTEEVVKIITQPNVFRGILTAIGNLLGMLFTGRKK